MIHLVKVSSDDNLSDLFTKAFDKERFKFLITGVGMRNLE